jgi:hypothetical protein
MGPYDLSYNWVSLAGPKKSKSFRGIHADGDTVIVEERMRATLPGGKPDENDYCFAFVLSGERIKLVREYMDSHPLTAERSISDWITYHRIAAQGRDIDGRCPFGSSPIILLSSRRMKPLCAPNRN